MVAELNAEVQRLHAAHLPDRFTAPDPAVFHAWAAERLARPDTDVWLAELEGTVVGYVLCVEVERPATPFGPARRFLELEQIGVTGAARRRGVGRRLVEQAVAEAEARGLGEVELSSFAFNTEAHALFVAMGFTPRIVRFVRATIDRKAGR